MQKISTYFYGWRVYGLLLLITLLIFWPLSFQVFSLKNDALVYFLPFRYQVSESIQHGCFPWWNPYIYTGLPLHSDIQSGVWNPVVMIISLFTSYNMTVLQWEMLFYLFMASVGMFKLLRHWVDNPLIALLAAVAYICSGFITDSGSLVPWITSAAWLPFVFLYYYRLLENPVRMTMVKFSLSLALLFTAGYPSFFIFSGYIMLAGLILKMIHNRKQKKSNGPLFRFGFFALLLFLVISSPVIFSWWDFLPYYDRGSGAGLDKSMSNSFPLFSAISYLIPSAVSRAHPWLDTDLSARNASIGIFLFLFFLLALFKKKTGLQKFILSIIVFSFLFSLGPATPVREWCHRFLPFMDTFRHPASMRVFTTLGMILIAAPALEAALREMAAAKKKIMGLALVILLAILGLMLYYLPQQTLAMEGGPIKKILDSLDFADMILLQGMVQLIFLAGFIYFILKRKTKLVPGWIFLQLLAGCWIALPFTFLSQVKPSTINAYVESFPGGFPAPDLQVSAGAAVYSDSASVSPLGYELFYAKKINIQDHLVSPTINRSYIEFLGDARLRQTMKDYPPVYFSDSSVWDPVPGNTGKIVLLDSTGRQYDLRSQGRGQIRLLAFSCNKLELETTPDAPALLNLFQQFHHGWRAWIDGSETPVYKTNRAFMSTPVPGGKHVVHFRFEPAGLVRFSCYLSGAALLFLALIPFFAFIKKKSS